MQSHYCQPTSGRQVDEWRSRLSAWLWPSVCVLCRGPGQPRLDLCAACAADLPRTEAVCVRCAAPLAAAPQTDLICGACLRRAPFFHAAYAPFRYGYPIDRLIQRLKYGRDGACGRVLGALLAQALAQRAPASLPQILIPMPLAARRYRERGFNQAMELARPLRSMLGLSVRNDLMVRLRETQEQAGLKQKERRRNVRGAFALCRPLAVQHAAILDDVITTGCTANEVAKVLRRAGVRKIEVWAAARTGESGALIP